MRVITKIKNAGVYCIGLVKDPKPIYFLNKTQQWEVLGMFNS